MVKKTHLLYGSLQKPFANNSFGLLHSKNLPPPFSPVGQSMLLHITDVGCSLFSYLDDGMLGDMPWACIGKGWLAYYPLISMRRARPGYPAGPRRVKAIGASADPTPGRAHPRSASPSYPQT